MAKNPNKIRAKRVASDYVIDIIMIVTIVLVLVLTLYPFLNSLAISLNDSNDTTLGGLTIYPRKFTWRNYELVFTNEKIWMAYFITIARTVIGTVGGVLITGMLAFAISRTNLVGKKVYAMLCLIPMYFGGGLMPSYFLNLSLGLKNNFLVYIIPALVNLWNMILMRSYFQSLPEALEESALIDGANYITIFFKIYFPLSTPIIATIALYFGVQHWNDWFQANLYITQDYLKPMQNVLLAIVNEAKFAEQMSSAGMGVTIDGNALKGKQTNVRSITMATMFVTIIPIIIVYPFLQRYFVKGIMIGSVKG